MIDTLTTHLDANLFMSTLALIVAICSMYAQVQHRTAIPSTGVA